MLWSCSTSDCSICFCTKAMALSQLDELFCGSSNKHKREAIMPLAGAKVESIVCKLEDNIHFHTIYVVLKRFLHRDSCLPQKRLPGRGKLMMMRNKSYNHLIKVIFPHHICLSIHYHSGIEEISICLGGRSLITPWHGVVVLQLDGSWCIMRKHQAEALGAELQDTLAPEHWHLLACELAGIDLREIAQYGPVPFYCLPESSQSSPSELQLRPSANHPTVLNLGCV